MKRFDHCNLHHRSIIRDMVQALPHRTAPPPPLSYPLSLHERDYCFGLVWLHSRGSGVGPFRALGRQSDFALLLAL